MAHWNKVTLVGLGLLGGSLGLALRKRGLAESVTGLVRRRESIGECTDLGVADSVTLDPAEAVSGADLVVLCTPIGAMSRIAESIAPHLSDHAVVTDVGSVKSSVVRDMESVLGDGRPRFVGSHPMAGRETAGVRHSEESLFEGRICVITPTPCSDAGGVDRVQSLWDAVGMQCLQMTPEAHDELVSRSSHLPHVVAAALAAYVLSPEHPGEQRHLCSTGFRDCTRVAAGDVRMWSDIISANRINLSWVLDDFIHELQAIQSALRDQDWEAVAARLAEAKQRRDDWESQFNSNHRGPSGGE